MAQETNQASTSSCLKDRLAETEEKAKAAEFHKATAATLQELISKTEKEVNSYREALPGFIATWQEQDEEFKEMKRRLESCYPNWECDLKYSVCKDVICKNWELRKTYESKMGPFELYLQYANADKTAATNHLSAWKTITSWIKKRLDDNKKLYDRICALDDCRSPLLQLYLFYFILWPQHRELYISPLKLTKNERSPEHAYCSSNECQPPVDNCTCLIGYPWIIPAENYDCQLTRVWEAWRIAGEKQVKAKSAFDQIAKDKVEYQASSTPEALEKAAEESLRRYDEKLGKLDEQQRPCPEAPCEEQTNDDTKDTCKIDPCNPVKEGEENDYKDQEVSDPCEPPEYLSPCEKPDPYEEPKQEQKSDDSCEDPEDTVQQQDYEQKPA